MSIFSSVVISYFDSVQKRAMRRSQQEEPRSFNFSESVLKVVSSKS